MYRQRHRPLRRLLATPLLPALLAAAVSSPATAQKPAKPVAKLQAKAQLATVAPLATRQVALERVFELDATFGDREVLEITLGRPGPIRVEAAWRGTAPGLALILNGPGQVGYYARKDGASPLAIDFEVTEELFRKGREWTVSIVNFSRRGRAVGRVEMRYPTATLPLARLAPDLRRIREQAIAQPSPGGGPPSGEGGDAGGQEERSILPDGRVQIRHPDGRVVIYEPDCGWTTIFPDGTSSRTVCAQVQTADLPDLPEDPAVQSFLETHRDHLLEQISRLVDHRQEEVDLYLDYESASASGLYEQIRLRTRLIDRLLP